MRKQKNRLAAIYLFRTLTNVLVISERRKLQLLDLRAVARWIYASTFTVSIILRPGDADSQYNVTTAKYVMNIRTVVYVPASLWNCLYSANVHKVIQGCIDKSPGHQFLPFCDNNDFAMAVYDFRWNTTIGGCRANYV